MVLLERAAYMSGQNSGSGDPFRRLAEDSHGSGDVTFDRIVSPDLADCLDFLLQPDKIQKVLATAVACF